ncbi:MAG TPA: electron transfer flavoprotein subunit alpha/FixB family protein [Bryobacteraceae bacterium]|nr:electron transfer flavoprotein subunit alpha/FixB family protein [Bryobacteraceae bacterium]HOQ46390.1 electron transfer flavoprotein subunit alpha/FixB family protein [Bryobacteraceae bacterium]HPQ15085.1 electron transfer flavoprotein subunit alpha/FixB family protein [Bryobacteraceae bacterium]HPU72173.1 electron transfer flavoprotein subunit alpha/FixB family protein [Bryobacteraceae bacterium]
MSQHGEVWVYAEVDDGAIAGVSLELLGKGRELAGILGVPLAAVILGSGTRPLAEQLIAYGADIVYSADDERLAQYTTLPFSRVLTDLIREKKPEIVLYGATPVGRDLAPRVASALKTGLTADCTDLQIGSYESAGRLYQKKLLQIRPAWGGNIIATIVSPDVLPEMATVREGVMHAPDPVEGRTGTIIDVPVVLDSECDFVRVIERHTQPRRVDLRSASIIVAGGYGMGSKENFQLVHELAAVLGGAVGASRAAVDAGFIHADHQVGQTGTTVRPKLYIACGISGAVQHRAGMEESAKIIAINTDPEAPIFQVAHYGIIGDVRDVIPRLIKAFKGKL